MLPLIGNLWRYRDFILGSVEREFRARYRNTMLGILWPLLQPLAMILVYTVVFSKIMHNRLPGVEGTFAYSIYLCSGIIAWGLFAEITLRTQNMFIDHANLVKKLNFPKICLPAIIVLSALLNFLIIFSLFLIFLLLINQFPGLPFLATPLVIALLIWFSSALGMIIGILNVFFRDIGQFYGIAVTFWFWLTPIVYPINILPDPLQSLIHINPLTPILGALQEILSRNTWPNWSTLLYPATLSLLLTLAAIRLYRLHSAEIVDEL